MRNKKLQARYDEWMVGMKVKYGSTGECCLTSDGPEKSALTDLIVAQRRTSLKLVYHGPNRHRHRNRRCHPPRMTYTSTPSVRAHLPPPPGITSTCLPVHRHRKTRVSTLAPIHR